MALAYLASNRPVAESVIDAVEQTDVNTSVTDIPEVESMKESESSNVPPSTDDMPVETPSDAAVNDSLDEIQDGMDSIKEDVESALDKVTPDDVPE